MYEDLGKGEVSRACEEHGVLYTRWECCVRLMNYPLITISRQCFASLKELRLVSSAIDEYNTLP
jgi:hypothetical protein